MALSCHGDKQLTSPLFVCFLTPSIFSDLARKRGPMPYGLRLLLQFSPEYSPVTVLFSAINTLSGR